MSQDRSKGYVKFWESAPALNWRGRPGLPWGRYSVDVHRVPQTTKAAGTGPSSQPVAPALNQNPDDARGLIVRSYDLNLFHKVVEDYYDGSDFANWGYWLSGTRTLKEACETLMEKLLALVPSKKGTVLDVACGKGATTRHLARYYSPENITGINISRKQLRRARQNAPGSKLLFMSATEMEFPDRCFDAVYCVEAAFHFDTRQRFLSEAFRVLRPGGHLVLSDILFRPGAEKNAPMLNGQNWVASPDAYRALLLNAGFQDVRVVDATHECCHGFDWHQLNYALAKYRAQEIDWKTFESVMSRRRTKRMSVQYYVLASGKKPGDYAAGATHRRQALS
jgi:MPBQ/MSBQ methyltransferase